MREIIVLILFFSIMIGTSGCAKKKKEVYVPTPKVELPKEVVKEEPPLKPIYIYSSLGRRDPFRPLITKVEEEERKEERVAVPEESLRIGSLHLSGLIWDGDETMAVLHDGGGFGYILKGGKLLGQNNIPINGIKGEIIGKEAVLIQGKERLKFSFKEKG